MDDACVQCGSPFGYCECVYADKKPHQNYHCNYCGFQGSGQHDCTEYISTLKMFAEFKKNEERE